MNEGLKQKIREKIDELESENDRILKGVNEDCQLPDSQAQAILRSSYHNNGSIQGLKDALGLVDEATKDLLNLAIHGLKEAQNGESSDCVSTFAAIIEKLGIHVEYDEWHEPIIDDKQVKAVLDGESETDKILKDNPLMEKIREARLKGSKSSPYKPLV